MAVTADIRGWLLVQIQNQEAGEVALSDQHDDMGNSDSFEENGGCTCDQHADLAMSPSAGSVLLQTLSFRFGETMSTKRNHQALVQIYD